MTVQWTVAAVRQRSVCRPPGCAPLARGPPFRRWAGRAAHGPGLWGPVQPKRLRKEIAKIGGRRLIVAHPIPRYTTRMTDPLATLAQAMTSAGFDGVEVDGPTLYARTADALEFQVTADDLYRLSIRYAVRATDAERAAWMRANPKGRLDIAQGETELTLSLPLNADLTAALFDWAALAHAGAVAAVEWRRRQKPLYGM